MSPEAVRTSGIILVTIPFVVYGGFFLFTQLVGKAAGYVDNPLRRSMFIAGHAHAGVLVLLGIVLQPLVDHTHMHPLLTAIARSGVPLAAILMPLGFFLSVPFPNTQRANAMRYFVYGGAVLVAVSVLVLGIGLLTTA